MSEKWYVEIWTSRGAKAEAWHEFDRIDPVLMLYRILKKLDSNLILRVLSPRIASDADLKRLGAIGAIAS